MCLMTGCRKIDLFQLVVVSSSSSCFVVVVFIHHLLEEIGC